ncbi:MAG: hypothetical protein LBL52_01890 [Rickettsiales bacterium]|nr:hypothetical protein [Rickettsiales bacterium]
MIPQGTCDIILYVKPKEKTDDKELTTNGGGQKAKYIAFALLLLSTNHSNSANYYTCSACVIPELCKEGASTDFDKYNAPLTLEQATAAIGTPDKSRWNLMSESVDSPKDKTFTGAFGAGIYRFDIFYPNLQSGATSRVVAFDRTFSFRNGNDSNTSTPWSSLSIDIDHASYQSASFAIQAPVGTPVSHTPGFPASEFPSNLTGVKQIIYKLN